MQSESLEGAFLQSNTKEKQAFRSEESMPV